MKFSILKKIGCIKVLRVPMLRYGFILLMVSSLVAGSFPLSNLVCAKTPQVSHEQIEAVYLYNFLQFVKWPQNDETAKNGLKVIAVLGNDPIIDSLAKLEQSLVESGKNQFKFRHFKKYSPDLNLSECTILFVSNSVEKGFADILHQAKGKPILTVTNSNNFFEKGAMILLKQVGDRIRYKINRDAAHESGLRISSQLLKSSL